MYYLFSLHNHRSYTLYSVHYIWQFHTISTEDIPVAILTAVALESDHVTVARALTSDVTLRYYVISETAEVEAIARWNRERHYTRAITTTVNEWHGIAKKTSTIESLN